MFTREGKSRIGTAVALAVVLAMAVAAPAGASGWSSWREARDLAGGFLPRVLVWLDLAPDPGVVLKCDDGSHIDPNGGCTKAAGKGKLQVDPSGARPEETRLAPAWRPLT